ncbi:MAG TPA: hypothetical protein VLA43_15540, partial [Longimicrobiales bacterium]|nr:hypothetical protein [Longimicrobiales bacterium]
MVFGVAAVAVTYPLGVQLFRRRFPALVAAALLAGMTAHVLYSQEARVYSLQLLLAILSAHYFFKSYWERRVSPAFLVSTTLLTYSHSFASWYFIAAQAVYVLVAWLVWRDGEAFRKGFVSQLLVLVLWLPLVGAFVYSRFAREIVVPTFWATAPEGLPGPMDLLELYQSLAVRSWAGAAFMTLLILLGLGILRRSAGFAPRPRLAPGAAAPSDGPPTGAAVVFLLAWVSVPVLFSLAVTVGTSLDTFPETRYHLAVLPGLCLLAAAGAARVTSRAGAVAVAALVLLLPASQLPRYYRDFTRVAYDQAASVIATHRAPGELIFVGGGFRTLAYYYRGSFPRIGSPEWDR